MGFRPRWLARLMMRQGDDLLNVEGRHAPRSSAELRVRPPPRIDVVTNYLVRQTQDLCDLLQREEPIDHDPSISLLRQNATNEESPRLPPCEG